MLQTFLNTVEISIMHVSSYMEWRGREWSVLKLPEDF